MQKEIDQIVIMTVVRYSLTDVILKQGDQEIKLDQLDWVFLKVA